MKSEGQVKQIEYQAHSLTSLSLVELQVVVLRLIERKMDGPENYRIYGSQSDSRAEIVVHEQEAQ